MAGRLWGDVVEVKILRDGSERTLPVPLTRVAAPKTAATK